MPPIDDKLASRVAHLMGSSPISCTARLGGYTSAGRWIMGLEDGRSVFVKAAMDEATAGWLRTEHTIYTRVKAPFIPAILGWDEAPFPILVLDDLSDACWPPPWRPGMVDAVLEALDILHRTPPLPGLPLLEDYRKEFTCWPKIAVDPEPFLRLGFCSAAWLDVALPALIQAEACAPLSGEAFLHMDVRSDNICVRDGHAFLVDWNWACVGNPHFDVAAWLPTLHAEGGPEPEAILPDQPGMASVMAGYFALVCPKPPLRPGCILRQRQREWLRSALLWTVRVLSLPALDGRDVTP